VGMGGSSGVSIKGGYRKWRRKNCAICVGRGGIPDNETTEKKRKITEI